MTEITQLVEILDQSGLEKAQTAPLIDKFGVFYTDAIKLTVQSKAIVIKDISQVEEMKQSREFRLKLKKIRTDADKVRIEMKEPFLRGANAVQSAYNGVEKITKEEEKRLEDQEKFIENLEKQRLQALAEKRAKELQMFEVDTQFYNLGDMDENAYQQLLAMSKTAFEAQKAKEAQEEKERQEAEEKENLFRERQLALAPYQSFTKEILTLETKEDDFNRILQEAKKAKKIYDDEQENIRKENEKLRKEAQEKEKQAAEQEQKRQEELKKAQDEADKAKKALEDKQEAERQAKIAEEKKKADDELAVLKAEKEARLAPDKDKLRSIYGKTKEFILQIKEINLVNPEAEAIKNDLVNSLVSQLSNIEKKAKEL